jgi:hypothetical protein
MNEKKPRRGVGRPPAGDEGERVSEYPALTVRLPVHTKNALLAVARLRGTPAWRLVDQAILGLVASLPADERRDVERFAKRMTSASRGEQGTGKA